MVRRTTGPLRTLLPAVAVGLAALLVGCSSGQVTQTDSMEPAVNGNRGGVGEIALRDALLAHPESGDYAAGDQAVLLLTIVNTGFTDDELLSVSSPAAASVELVGNPSLPGNTALQVVEPEEPIETGTSEPSEPSQPSQPSQPSGTETSVPEESITEPSPPAETGEESAAPPPESDVAPPPSGSSETSDPENTVTPTAEAPAEVGTISIVLVGLVQDLPLGRNVPVTFVFAEAGQITLQLPIAPPATARPDPPATEDEGGH